MNSGQRLSAEPTLKAVKYVSEYYHWMVNVKVMGGGAIELVYTALSCVFRHRAFASGVLALHRMTSEIVDKCQ